MCLKDIKINIHQVIPSLHNLIPLVKFTRSLSPLEERKLNDCNAKREKNKADTVNKGSLQISHIKHSELKLRAPSGRVSFSKCSCLCDAVALTFYRVFHDFFCFAAIKCLGCSCDCGEVPDYFH